MARDSEAGDAGTDGNESDWEAELESGALARRLEGVGLGNAVAGPRPGASHPSVPPGAAGERRGVLASSRDVVGWDDASSERPRPRDPRDDAGMAGPTSPLPDTVGSLPDGARHVLELHGFPPSTDREDVDAALDAVSGGARVRPYVVWVDDTHCLAVFAGPEDARAALGAHYARLREEGTRLDGVSMRMAADSAHPATRAMPLGRLPPAKPRPKGTAALARRLIGGALGIDMERQVAAMSREEGDRGERGKRMASESRELRELRERTARERAERHAERAAAEARAWY